MSISRTIDIPAVIDANKVGGFQKWILILVGLTVVMDGFDVQSMGYVAPVIIKEWGVNKAMLGPVFGAGLLGMLVGSLALSVLADRIGRRPVLIWASVFFAVFMIWTAHATSIRELEILRFIAGLGLGAIMPNAMALAGEYSPKHRRVTLMMLVSCGFTLGAVLGGLVSAALISAFGWRSVFWVGGIFPLIMAVLMYIRMPESLQFLVLRGKHLDRVGACLKKIDPSVRIDRDTEYVVPEPKGKGTPVGELFRHGRAKATLLLWVVNFMNLLNLYFLSNWLPTIAASSGLTTTNAVLVGTALQAGGVLGTVLMGPAIDRVGFYRVLVPCFLVAAVTIALIGQPGLSLAVLFVVVTITGFCIIGGQPAVNALAATYYPTAERSTGVGWSLGIGRFGSIVGPVLGGILIQYQWSNAGIFYAVAVPALISALMLWLMSRETGTSPNMAAAAVGH
ncbi:MFS transporter [Rhodoferax sediminis]|uniref:MFS transporter n=1 Tax=Rhodoferax sediminis TaxID=2509614 RepID=A0A515DGH9_9BURK|nr:MFS transporter [Rhodoferax sediminis]QDL39504.1 MFS transporter [Rhodoferax sediminis]